MKVFLICNPISGGGKGAEMLAKLRDELARRAHECEFFQTNQAGDAERCAAKLSGDYAVLGVIGGDGTLSEVINGLPDCARYPILSIPAGTANMLCKELSIPDQPAALVDTMERGNTCYADLGQAEFVNASGAKEKKKFLLVASAGFDAYVTKEVKLRRKGALGYFGYFIPLLRSLLSYNFPRMTAEVDSQPGEECSLAIIGNTKNYGGIFSVTSWADLCSGKYEVGLLKKSGRIALLMFALRAMLHRVSLGEGFCLLQGVQIKLKAENPVPVELDGDWVGYTPLAVKILAEKACLLIS